MSNEGERPSRGHKPALHRTLFIDITDLDLNAVEGQNELLRRAQVLLATKDHNTLDLAAFKILKESVKVKTDINVWFEVEKMKKTMAEWKEAQGKK